MLLTLFQVMLIFTKIKQFRRHGISKSCVKMSNSDVITIDNTKEK